MQFQPQSLTRALEAVPANAWSPPSTLEQSHAHQGYRVVSLVEIGHWLAAAEPFRVVLDEFDPVRTAWLSWLDPGGFILPHVDEGPYYERWQVPIQPAGTMNGRPATAGEAFRVKHWNTHSVVNGADHPRIHLVIDRDVVVDQAATPFHLREED